MIRSSVLIAALAVAACGQHAPEDDFASAEFDIQQAPGDAVCVQIAVTGATRAVTRSFNLTPGQSTTSLTASGLPIGALVITGNAYGVLCGGVTGSTPATWVVTPANATFTVAGPNAVTLTLTRNGQATLSIDFQDDQRTVSTLAGTAGLSGSVDGTGAAARFNQPTGLALDGSGNLYISEFGNNTIRKLVISTGAVTTLAGTAGTSGTADGTGAAARFSGLSGLACDGANLYVVDSGNCTIRKLVLATAAVTTLAGQPCNGSGADGTGAAARFNGPNGAALDGSGNLYVSEFGAVRQIVLSTGAVTTLAGSLVLSGYADGPAASALFHTVRGIAFDSGVLWLSDTGNQVIRKLTVQVVGSTVSTVAGSTAALEADGVGTAAQLAVPYGLASDGRGNVIVADFLGDTIRKVVESSGVVVTVAGSTTPGSADGIGAAAGFHSPGWVAIDAAGAVYVSDIVNNTIRKL